MPFKDIMRFIVYSTLLTILSCSSGSQKTSSQGDTIQSVARADTTQSVVRPSNTQRQNDESEEDFRREFISIYEKPVFIDTLLIDNGKTYKVIFHHFSTMDNSLIVPAKYNLDTNKDFVTHNFASDLTVVSEKDTIFRKHITKYTFNNLLDTLDTPLKEYATLLYPTLSIKNDIIHIHYNISIPVTDIGIGTYIKFDKNGNYTIEQ